MTTKLNSTAGIRLTAPICSPFLSIKVKRWEYEITERDKFLDNGACVQLLTQGKQRDSWGRKITPILSKKAINQIGKFKRVPCEYPGLLGVNVFSLENISDTMSVMTPL